MYGAAAFANLYVAVAALVAVFAAAVYAFPKFGV